VIGNAVAALSVEDFTRCVKRREADYSPRK